MYDRPLLSLRNQYSTLRNRSLFDLFRQNLNCIILQELTFHNPLSIHVSPLASLRWIRTAPYYSNCYSTTIFNVWTQLKCFQFVVDIRWSRVNLITWLMRYFSAAFLDFKSSNAFLKRHPLPSPTAWPCVLYWKPPWEKKGDTVLTYGIWGTCPGICAWFALYHGLVLVYFPISFRLLHHWH